jgi:hypothetical protein
MEEEKKLKCYLWSHPRKLYIFRSVDRELLTRILKVHGYINYNQIPDNASSLSWVVTVV